MSILYQTIAKAVALRANQLKDAATNAALNTQYGGNISGNLDGMEVPLLALKQTILASEKRIVDLIGKTKNPILRAPLLGYSEVVGNGEPIPGANIDGVPFVGFFDSIIDAGDRKPLTEQPKQVVLRRIANAGEFYKLPAYHFCFEGSSIFHTRPSVLFAGCMFDDVYAALQFDNVNGVSLLNPSLESFWIADVLNNLPQENWFIQEAQIYGNLVSKGEQMLLQGVIPQAILPDTTANQEPIKN